MNLRHKFLGAMVGGALGDAIGEMVLSKARRGPIDTDHQFLSVGKDALLELLSEFPQDKYTDDTAMAIGIPETLIARHGIELQYLGDRFRWNLNNEPWRGYGTGPAMIFLSVSSNGSCAY